MSSCTYIDECGNANRSCFKCFNFNYLKPLKEVKGLKAVSDRRKEKKDGMDFEKKGTANYNHAVTRGRDAARRQIASGALSHALGDMITEEQLTAALAEYKLRGSTDAKGEKQITIKKEWLDKLKWEASQMKRDHYFLPFGFKGSDTFYVAMEYDVQLSYIQMIQMLHEENRLLRMQLEGDSDK